MQLLNRINVLIRCSFLTCGICLLLLMTQVADINWYGFGADSSGQVYIGFSSHIGVYKEGIVVGKVDIPTYRAYSFTTQDGDSFILSNTQHVITMDLSGNILSTTEDAQCDTYESLRLVNEVTSGNKYFMRNNRLLRTTIIDDQGVMHYQMPLLDYAVKLVLIGSVVCIVALSPFDVYHKIRSRVKNIE